jgi:eukaryotic-like serine/threonine-protein kinase
VATRDGKELALKNLMDDRAHERFGRYEMLSELGRGAMGVVYKARDPKINRIVAVKTISLDGQPVEDELDYRERFFREAEAAGRVSHPGIVTIFDVGEEPDTRTPYIVMEFVNGESLDKLLSRNDDHRLPVETALRLAIELAEALDCAHRQGVVHRDLKPSNILMTEDGHAKIADFGVAKLNLSNQTLAGRALGTPAYMSPEQLNGDVVDGRSDLFSLGVILYTVLTGHRPFQGNSAFTVSFKVVNHEPMPPTLFDTALPEGLDAIIARAMAKDRTDRYQSGMEMVADIRKLQQQQGRQPANHAASPALSNGAQVAIGKQPPPAVVQPAPDQTADSQPTLSQAAAFSQTTLSQEATSQESMSQEAMSQSATTQAAASPATGSQSTLEPLAPVKPVPVAPKSPSSTRTLPNRNIRSILPIPSNSKMNTPAARLRKKSLVAVAVLAGLFVLGLWVISLGTQGTQLRVAEPLRPSAAILALNTTTPAASSIASAEKTPSPSAGSKDRTKTHRTDSHATGANAIATAARPMAPGAKEKDPSLSHRTDSRPAKVPHPVVAELSAVVLPVVTAKVTAADPATLEIEVDHKFAEAQLSIWVDDSLSYTHSLEGTAKKRLVVFHHVEGHELHAMPLAPGKHRLRVRVTSDTPAYDQSAFVSSDFTSGQENVLQITFNKHGDITLNLQ